MVRTSYSGAVRDSVAEQARDARMLALTEQGVSATIVAERMGVTVNSVRMRVKRALAARSGGMMKKLQSKAEGPDPS